MNSPTQTVLERVFAIIPGPELAKKLDISRVSVWKWHRVPTERVVQVAEITGIPPHELRPDLPSLFPPPSNEDQYNGTPP